MQIGPRIRFDHHTLGNLVKNISPALALTPLGLPGVAAASALGDLGRGKHNLLDIAKGAAGNVAIGAGGRSVAGHFGALGQGGAAAAPPSVGGLPDAQYASESGPSAGAAAPDLTHAASSTPFPSVPNLTASAAAPQGTPGPLGRIASGAGNALGWAGDHAATVGNVGSALGSLATAGPRNRAENAQTKLLEQQAQQNDYDYNQRKARDLALEPLRQALVGQIVGGFSSPGA